MKFILITILFTLNFQNAKAQLPNLIVISYNDTINNQNDCALNITLSRSDKKSFHFPKNYSIGEITDNVDLAYNIEKLVDGKYVSYRCNQSPIAVPGFPNKKIEYKKFKTLQLIDSLQGFECLERGQYRIQIQYNNKGDYGLEAVNIAVESNWVDFFVVPNKISLGYSRFIKKRN